MLSGTKELTTCVHISAGHTSIEDPEHTTSWELSSVSFVDRDTEARQTEATIFSPVSPKLECHQLMAWHRQEFTSRHQDPLALRMSATDGSTGQTWPELEKAYFFLWGVLSPRTVHLSSAMEQLQGNQPTALDSGKFWLINKFYLKISQIHGQYILTASI